MIENCVVRNREKNIYLIGVTVLAGMVLIAMACRLTVPVISDETTTMANAAWLGGYDWHLMVISLGGLYYRFGQALLTVPFFTFLDDPDMIYRLSMILQALIQVSTIPVVYVICMRHLSVKSEKLAALMGAAVCLVPSIALYVFYYRGDFLLSVLPWYVLLSFLEAMRAAKEGKRLRRILWTITSIALYVFYYRGDFLLSVLPWYVLLSFLEAMRAAKEGKRLRRILWTITAVFFATYSYTAHTRGIIVLIALLMTAIAVRIFLKQKSLSWTVLIGIGVVCFAVDSCTGQMLKDALYSMSGLNANAIESTDMKSYFSIFSYDMIKDLFMLSLSWLHTLIVSGHGFVLIGTVASGMILLKTLIHRNGDATDNEFVLVLFCLLVFFGYYAVGALFFKGTYLAFATGALTKRVDRLLYDRYAICGAGMVVFVALYTLCIRRDWLKWKSKAFCIISALGVFFIWFQKILPLAAKYKGYLYNTIILNTFQKIKAPKSKAFCIISALGVFFIWFQKILPLAAKYKGYLYNTIILNTFQKIKAPEKIMWGQKYGREALLAISFLGIGLMIAILAISFIKKKWMPYLLLGVVLFSDLILIQVNYVKVRKATNDYTVEATADVVDFMQEFEEKITPEYPYVLKGKLSGIKIQFYQSQLMNYQMFGKEQEEELGFDDYFIISAHDDIDLTWYEDDYYLFEDFDYENAEYDVVYVKGESLMKRLEQLGYSAHDDIDLTWYEDDYYLFEDFDYENAEYDVVYVKGESLMKRLEQLGYEMTKYVP